MHGGEGGGGWGGVPGKGVCVSQHWKNIFINIKIKLALF